MGFETEWKTGDESQLYQNMVARKDVNGRRKKEEEERDREEREVGMTKIARQDDRWCALSLQPRVEWSGQGLNYDSTVHRTAKSKKRNLNERKNSG